MRAFGKERDAISTGIGLTVLSVLIFGIQYAATKTLVQTWSPFQISMMRFWAFGLFSLLMVTRQAPLKKAFHSKMPGWQLLRGTVLTGEIWMFALAVRSVPLAELHSIILLYPLLVTLLAIPVLGERVGPWRLGAVFAGFVGALVILRPGGLPLTPDVVFALGAATANALYLVLTRKVAQVDTTSTSMVYAGVVGMVLMTLVGVWFWMPMDGNGLLLLSLVIVTTIVAHGLMMIALKLAPASVLQPFNYLMLPWAGVLSLVVFGHLIDGVSLIGALIIVGSGLIVWMRERRARSTSRGSTVPPQGAER